LSGKGGLRTCGRCGRIAEIRIRAKGAEPDICSGCAPVRQSACGICGRIGGIAVSATPTSPAVGRCCYQPPVALCSVCHRERPCYHAASPEPICPTCAGARRRARCLDCGRERPPALRVKGGVLCQSCAWRRGGSCKRCGEDGRLRGGLCPRCRLAARLERLARSGDPVAASRLAPYLALLAASPNPESTHRWTFTPTYALLIELAAGQVEISHAALDERAAADLPPAPRAIAFLRAGLVEAGVLEQREEAALAFERWLPGALARLPPGRGRALLTAYARWEVAPRLGRAPSPRWARPAARQKHARSAVNEAITLAAWLAEQGLSLADLRQDLVDSWIGAGATTPRQVRLFLAWLKREGTTPPLSVAWWEGGPSPGPLSEERRLDALRRLLHEEGAQPPERIAGCLLLLFGQPLTRSAALRAGDVQAEADGEVAIVLGRGSVPVPEPLGTLALSLREAALARGGEAAWLFPGRLPGTHRSAEAIGKHLRRGYGVNARAARRAALMELATRLPAPILAERFGFHQARAAKWVRDAGRTYADYLALRSG
jgi:hypothetical protein